MEATALNWAFIILLAVVVFFLFGWMRGGNRSRRKAPNILGDNGWPKTDTREGSVRNDEE